MTALFDGKTLRNHYPPEFEAFWKAYPRTKDVPKSIAFKAWKLVTRDSPIDVIMGCLERCKSEWAADKRQMRHIPHPSTWLNQRRWEDERIEDTGYRAPDASAGLACGSTWPVSEAPLDELPF